jgi:hypothetical protein
VGAGVVASSERRGMAHGSSDAEWQPDRGVCGREHCRPEHGWDRGRGAGTVRWIAGYMQCWVSGGSDERTVVELLRRGRCGCAAVRGGADGAAGDAAVRGVSAGIDPQRVDSELLNAHNFCTTFDNSNTPVDNDSDG